MRRTENSEKRAAYEDALMMMYSETAEEQEETCCDTCAAKSTCAFYEKGADECVYEVLAEYAKKSKGA